MGSSLSQMIAVWSPRVARCRSRQETEAFSVPSSNHLIETSPAKLVFLILVGGFIQAMRFASSRPEPVRVARGTLVHLVIAFRVHVGMRRDLRANRDDMAVGGMGIGHGQGPSIYSLFRRDAERRVADRLRSIRRWFKRGRGSSGGADPPELRRLRRVGGARPAPPWREAGMGRRSAARCGHAFR